MLAVVDAWWVCSLRSLHIICWKELFAYLSGAFILSVATPAMLLGGKSKRRPFVVKGRSDRESQKFGGGGVLSLTEAGKKWLFELGPGVRT